VEEVVGEVDDAGVWTERETTGMGDDTGAVGGRPTSAGGSADLAGSELAVGPVAIDLLTIGRSVDVEAWIGSGAPMVGKLGAASAAAPMAGTLGAESVWTLGGLSEATERLTTGRSVVLAVVPLLVSATASDDSATGTGALSVGISTAGCGGLGEPGAVSTAGAGAEGAGATRTSGRDGIGRGSIGGSVTGRDGGAGVTDTARWTGTGASNGGRAKCWTGGRSAPPAGVATPVTSPDGA
jgi:hypothetical protein